MESPLRNRFLLWCCCFALTLWIIKGQETVPASDPNSVCLTDTKDTTHPGQALSILLVTSPYPGHIYPITALGEELVKRGHNVTLCATVMEGSDLLPALPHSYGINFISAGPDLLTQTNYTNWIRGFQNDSVMLLGMSNFIAQLGWRVTQLQSTLKETGAVNFHFIVCDVLSVEICLEYNKQSLKVMILSPTLNYEDATIPNWPSPVLFTGLSDNLPFLPKIANFVHYFLVRYVFLFAYHQFILPSELTEIVKIGDRFTYSGIRIPMVMATAFGLEYPKTRYPLTEYVGPLMMSYFPPLEDQLVEWLDSKPNRSVIYVGMGATGFMTTPIAQVVINGILATDFSAVWALPMSNQAVLEGVDFNNNRFFISKWIPRQTLFKHPKIVMTILHCAMNSVQESLYNGLPMVCVPHAFDHFDVAARVASAQVGIPLYSLTNALKQGKKFLPDDITKAIRNITDTSRYHEQAKKLRRIFQFAGGTRRASDLVEFYTEVGYDHLIPAYAKYEWSCVHYYNLDVYSVLFLLSFLLTHSAYRLIKCCCRKCCCFLLTASIKTKTE